MKSLKIFRSSVPSACGIFLLAAGLAGCGPDRDGRVPVSGDVSYQSEPLALGEVRFIAADGSNADAARIRDGKFDGFTRPGSKRIEIYGYRASDDLESYEQFLPEQFNEDSQLTEEIPPEGNSALHFNLE